MSNVARLNYAGLVVANAAIGHQRVFRAAIGLIRSPVAGSPAVLASGMPNVSVELRASVLANAAILPAGVGGAINVFVNCPTDVLFDINGYFAPSSLEAEAELKLRAD